ncbi:LuxR C-terminal-related transcriptional regulator, partial [Streptomyces sp. NPDC058247]|uniref:helix-turn-helix transcriptional regulator n=1 Tax=Streptomyces sp. NPDC058247 TaxID=3346401 RepID=UPI0036E57791
QCSTTPSSGTTNTSNGALSIITSSPGAMAMVGVNGGGGPHGASSALSCAAQQPPRADKGVDEPVECRLRGQGHHPISVLLGQRPLRVHPRLPEHAARPFPLALQHLYDSSHHVIVGPPQRRKRPVDPLIHQPPHALSVLVSKGQSNPAIAGQLLLSRRTVETHVSHILAKTTAKRSPRRLRARRRSTHSGQPHFQAQ